MEKGELLVSGPQSVGPELGGPESQPPISELSYKLLARKDIRNPTDKLFRENPHISQPNYSMVHPLT